MYVGTFCVMIGARQSTENGRVCELWKSPHNKPTVRSLKRTVGLLWGDSKNQDFREISVALGINFTCKSLTVMPACDAQCT